mmetsp:Transcript_4128/g.6068  ORF Transcript_4128/g.6068 Transcript_4128/m.6068 type:complete len:81 (+) Transcript_4128:281-523(+)
MIVQALQDAAKAMSGLQVDESWGWVMMHVMLTHGKSHAYGPSMATPTNFIVHSYALFVLQFTPQEIMMPLINIFKKTVRR